VASEKAKLSQYEAIGLLLYAFKEQKADPKTIALLLQNSGIKVSNVSARLKEMADSGRVFKPDPKDVMWKLSAQGQMWVEKTIIPKARGGFL
jgi:predicted transcriptional regulator